MNKATLKRIEELEKESAKDAQRDAGWLRVIDLTDAEFEAFEKANPGANIIRRVIVHPKNGEERE